MDTKRQMKYAKMLQKEMSNIFQIEMRGAFGNAFITITHVEVSPDMSVAKFYLSFMLAESNEALLDQIRDSAKKIRQILGTKIRHQVRIIPEVIFFMDDSASYAIKMDKIISDLKVPKNPMPES
ncbi:MAG: 30S ribosome-binding factor RbfA [Bacteroidota bacterium]|nr:30S ribosome-binding factor RbfA [Bacteroidota bacterium]